MRFLPNNVAVKKTNFVQELGCSRCDERWIAHIVTGVDAHEAETSSLLGVRQVAAPEARPMQCRVHGPGESARASLRTNPRRRSCVVVSTTSYAGGPRVKKRTVAWELFLLVVLPLLLLIAWALLMLLRNQPH